LSIWVGIHASLFEDSVFFVALHDSDYSGEIILPQRLTFVARFKQEVLLDWNRSPRSAQAKSHAVSRTNHSPGYRHGDNPPGLTRTSEFLICSIIKR
jgi:hypothetical protein